MVDEHFEKDHKICFAKCKAGFNDDIFFDYGITSLPTMVFYKKGKPYPYRKTVGPIRYSDLVFIIAEGILQR